MPVIQVLWMDDFVVSFPMVGAEIDYKRIVPDCTACMYALLATKEVFHGSPGLIIQLKY